MEMFASDPIVHAAWENRFKIHKSGEIIKFDKSCLWKEALFNLEKEKNILGMLKYVLYQDRTSNHWRVHSVPLELGSYDSRRPLREEWRGKTAEQIRNISRVKDAVFCHHSGFIGGAKSLEGCIKLADLSLK